jgi:glycogen operon protein
MSPEDWAFPEARFLTYVLAAIGEGGAPLFIVLNSGGEAVEFVFPEFLEFESWAQVLTTVPGPHGGDQSFHVGAKYSAERHSIMAFEGRT